MDYASKSPEVDRLRLSVRTKSTHPARIARRNSGQVDNVEDRQSRIAQEEREGGKGTAYAIAVTHMLKKDPPAAANAPSSGDRSSSGTDIRNKKSSLRKVGGSASSAASTSEGGMVDATPSRDGCVPKAQTGVKEGASNGAEGVDGAAVVGVRFAGVGGDKEERHEDGRDDPSREALVVDQDRDVVGGSDGNGGSDGESDLDSEGESEFSGASAEEGEGGGHTRRNWAERRARLRKDGMHGRRLPPPQAEEERASAKAEKREVRGR